MCPLGTTASARLTASLAIGFRQNLTWLHARCGRSYSTMIALLYVLTTKRSKKPEKTAKAEKGNRNK
jgi:hypothetical protein